MDPINSFCRKLPLNFLIALGGTSCCQTIRVEIKHNTGTKSLGPLNLYSCLTLFCIALYPRRHPGPSSSFLSASFTSLTEILVSEKGTFHSQSDPPLWMTGFLPMEYGRTDSYQWSMAGTDSYQCSTKKALC